jgi:hypothetical protein
MDMIEKLEKLASYHTLFLSKRDGLFLFELIPQRAFLEFKTPIFEKVKRFLLHGYEENYLLWKISKVYGLPASISSSISLSQEEEYFLIFLTRDGIFLPSGLFFILNKSNLIEFLSFLEEKIEIIPLEGIMKVGEIISKNWRETEGIVSFGFMRWKWFKKTESWSTLSGRSKPVVCYEFEKE